MKIRKYTQYIYIYIYIFHTTLHPDTMSDQVGQTDRKSTHNTESTLGLAAAFNLQRLGVESSNEKK